MQPRAERVRRALAARADEDDIPVTMRQIERLAEAALHPILTDPGLPSRRSRGGRELTTVHAEIMLGIANGLPLEAIARRMLVLESTVRTQVRETLAALGAASEAHAVALLIAQGLLDPADVQPTTHREAS